MRVRSIHGRQQFPPVRLGFGDGETQRCSTSISHNAIGPEFVVICCFIYLFDLVVSNKEYSLIEYVTTCYNHKCAGQTGRPKPPFKWGKPQKPMKILEIPGKSTSTVSTDRQHPNGTSPSFLGDPGDPGVSASEVRHCGPVLGEHGLTTCRRSIPGKQCHSFGVTVTS